MLFKFLYFPFMHQHFMSIPSGYIRIERDYDFLYPSHVNVFTKCYRNNSFPLFVSI